MIVGSRRSTITLYMLFGELWLSTRMFFFPSVYLLACHSLQFLAFVVNWVLSLMGQGFCNVY